MSSDSFPILFSREFAVFLALAETHSFDMTGQKYGLSASTVSRLISHLEESLHIELFDRSVKPMVLTPEGRWFFREMKPQATRIQHILKQIQASVKFKTNLRIGFIDSFTYEIAPDFIEKIQPQVLTISCLSGGADRLVERLTVQEVDVILTINPCFDLPNLRRHLLLTEPSVILFPKKCAGRLPAQPSWKDIQVSGLPFISNYSVSGGGKLETQFFTTHDLKITGTIHTDNLGMRLKLVSQGRGWAIVRPLTILKHFELLKDLTVVKVPPPGILRNIYILARPNISKELFQTIISILADILEEKMLPRMVSLLDEETAKQVRIAGIEETEKAEKNPPV